MADTAEIYDLSEELSREQANNKRNAGETWNDARIHGEASEEFDALMGCTAPLIEKDWGKRFMPTRGWRSKPKTWGDWLDDSLTWHREDDRKDGAGYVFGASANGERKAENMRGMVAIGLDIEPEQPLADVISRCEASGLAIVLYTSHNHNRTTDSEAVDTILKHGDEVTTETVRAYLRYKEAYSEDFIAQCELIEPRADIDGKIQAIWSCPPLQKMRAIALFEEPVDVTTLDPSPKRGQEIWANKVRGLAKMLGVQIDPVATDPSRILYIPKHRPGADWYCAVFRGRPVQWEEIPEVAKGADNPFLQAGGGKGGSTIPDVVTSTGVDVTALYRCYGKRWMLADMLSDSHVAKGEGSDRLHVECPFSDEHTSESGPTSTTVWNAGETDHGFAKVLCQHTCKDRYHTVDYVARWIEDGVIDPAWLEDDSFMIGAPDQPGPFEELTPAELEEERAARDEQARSYEEQAAQFTAKSSDEDIRKFIKKLFREGVDRSTQANVTAAIAGATNLGKRDVKAWWKELEDAQQRRDGGQEAPTGGILLTEPAPELTQYAADAVKAANEKVPFLFEYMEVPTIVRRGRIKALNRAGRRHELGKVTQFLRQRGEGHIHDYPPYDVVDDLFSSDLSEFCLPLRGAVDTPFFAADGALVTENGYHAGSQMYLDSEMVLAGVSPRPTAEEVQEAKRLLVDNVLADFPLGGLTRPEIMAALDGEAIPAVTHAVGLTLLPFMREMIDGPTPGWILSKPAPGTGASLLVKLLTTIASGVPAPESTLPSNKEEVPKTLAALLQNDPTHIVFDNINHSVDSGDLASAQTARTYQARVLGKTQTIEVDVRSLFIFTANNVTLSNELLRRSIFIPLDAKVEAPEKRTGFLHEDVFKWVDTRRAELVHACLTLIQNWVAQGMPRSAHSLASFEDWAKVTGGILEAAGFAGFLEGQEDAKALAADAAQDSIDQLMDVLSDYPDGTLFRPGGAAKFNSEPTVNLVDILNGEERAKIEPGDDKPDPIQINSWGYSPYDGCYKTGGRVRPGFEKLARKPRRGASGDGSEYVLHFEAIPDTKNKGVVFRMSKVPVTEGE